MSRTAAWIGVLLICLSAVAVYGGIFVVLHRSERCVQHVLAAQQSGLATWEAVQRCQR